jgi:hypothetical protein
MPSVSEASVWENGSNVTTTIQIEGSLQDLPSSSGLESISLPHITVEQPSFESKLFFLKYSTSEWTKATQCTLRLSSNPASTSSELLAPIDEETFDSLKQTVKEHFEIESGLHLVAIYSREVPHQFLLIEVNDEAIPTGRIEPFYFAPSEDFVWSIYIADVTRNEWEGIEKGTIKLPQGWIKKPILIFQRAEVLGK